MTNKTSASQKVVKIIEPELRRSTENVPQLQSFLHMHYRLVIYEQYRLTGMTKKKKKN